MIDISSEKNDIANHNIEKIKVHVLNDGMCDEECPFLSRYDEYLIAGRHRIIRKARTSYNFRSDFCLKVKPTREEKNDLST